MPVISGYGLGHLAPHSGAVGSELRSYRGWGQSLPGEATERDGFTHPKHPQHRLSDPSRPNKSGLCKCFVSKLGKPSQTRGPEGQGSEEMADQAGEATAPGLACASQQCT